MERKPGLLEIASICVKRALSMGAEEVEAYVWRGRGCIAHIKMNEFSDVSSLHDEGVGLRILVEGKMGFVYCSNLSLESLDEIVRNGIKLAKASKTIQDWLGFKEPDEKYPPIPKIFDSKIDTIGSSKIVEMALEALDSAISIDKRVVVVNGKVLALKETKAIVNTNGIYNIDHGTIIGVGMGAVVHEAGMATPVVSEYDYSRMMTISPGKIGRSVGEKALSCLNPISIRVRQMPVIMTEKALYYLLKYTLFEALKADNVVKGRSPLINKIGKPIASEKLTILDDGSLPGGLNSWSFDDEGARTRRTIIVGEGELKGFLTDNYYAHKINLKNTANALRSSFSRYIKPPQIAPLNAIILPGDWSKEEMLSESNGSLLVDGLQGAHSSNPETGEFSVVATPAWLIREGELKPVKNVMMAGNIYNIIKDIEALSKETRQVDFLIAPWIKFEKMRIIT